MDILGHVMIEGIEGIIAEKAVKKTARLGRDKNGI